MGLEWNLGSQCLRNLQMKIASASAHCDYERSDWGYVWINKVGKQILRCRNIETPLMKNLMYSIFKLISSYLCSGIVCVSMCTTTNKLFLFVILYQVDITSLGGSINPSGNCGHKLCCVTLAIWHLLRQGHTKAQNTHNIFEVWRGAI